MKDFCAVSLFLVFAVHDGMAQEQKNDTLQTNRINDLSSTYKCNFLGADNKQ